MKLTEFYAYTEQTFDSFCKQVIRNERTDALRELTHKSKRETVFSALTPVEMARLTTVDRSPKTGGVPYLRTHCDRNGRHVGTSPFRPAGTAAGCSPAVLFCGHERPVDRTAAAAQAGHGAASQSGITDQTAEIVGRFVWAITFPIKPFLRLRLAIPSLWSRYCATMTAT